jgi:hypothetical protein
MGLTWVFNSAWMRYRPAFNSPYRASIGVTINWVFVSDSAERLFTHHSEALVDEDLCDPCPRTGRAFVLVTGLPGVNERIPQCITGKLGVSQFPCSDLDQEQVLFLENVPDQHIRVQFRTCGWTAHFVSLEDWRSSTSWTPAPVCLFLTCDRRQSLSEGWSMLEPRDKQGSVEAGRG